MPTDKDILLGLFGAALDAAQPDGKFAAILPTKPAGRTIVLGAGKAGARMARAFEDAWEAVGNGPLSGLVVTRYGHGMPTRAIEVIEASHPVPDAAGEAAARRILALAQSAGADDLVVFLISGGASALLTLPAPGLSLAEKQEINRTLLKSGAPISVMNTLRKSLSAIKGGRLAAAASPARTITYIISDVPGDDPAIIGSGPTIQADDDLAAMRAALDRYGVHLPPQINKIIDSNPPPVIAASPVHMIATPQMALDAAARKAREFGLTPIILGDAIEGEAREVGKAMAETARFMSADPASAKPCVLISGGETTVTISGASAGRGGRNTEFLLALAVALDGTDGVSAIACDTDGIDGSEDSAGAWYDPGLPALARATGIDLVATLDAHDSCTAFAALDRLVVTGPTLTNVNDFRAILIR